VSTANPELRRHAIISLFGDCLVASVQSDLDEAGMGALRTSLLDSVRQRQPRGVVIDVSALDLLDAYDFEALRRTMAMVELLGVRAVLVGLSPIIVAALVEHDAATDGVVAEPTLEAGLARARGAS
jgi:rsbT antagonist protein RsbS